MKDLMKALEASMNRYHRMYSADKKQFIYVGMFDFLHGRLVRTYAYNSCYNYKTEKYLVTCKRICKDRNPHDNSDPNIWFEFKIIDDDNWIDGWVAVLTEYLG